MKTLILDTSTNDNTEWVRYAAALVELGVQRVHTLLDYHNIYRTVRRRYPLLKQMRFDCDWMTYCSYSDWMDEIPVTETDIGGEPVPLSMMLNDDEYYVTDNRVEIPDRLTGETEGACVIVTDYGFSWEAIIAEDSDGSSRIETREVPVGLIEDLLLELMEVQAPSPASQEST